MAQPQEHHSPRVIARNRRQRGNLDSKYDKSYLLHHNSRRKSRRKVSRLFTKITKGKNISHYSIHRNIRITIKLPHVKKLTGAPLWEIRILGQDNIRVLYVLMHQDEILLVHGFVKKKQKTPLKEIETALGRAKDWQKRLTES